MKKILLLPFLLLFFAACNQNEQKSVKMIRDTCHTVPTGYTTSVAKMKETREVREENLQKEIALAKLKSEENLQLAKIEVEGKKEIKQIESEALRAKVVAEKEVHLQAQLTQKEIAAAKEKRLVETQEKDLFLYQIAIAVLGGLVLIILLVYYLIQRHNKSIEMKLHEEKLRHDAQMQQSAQQHEKMGRMLDIIADEAANEHVRHALIGVLKEQTVSQNLIAYRADDEKSNDEKGDDEKEVLDVEEEKTEEKGKES